MKLSKSLLGINNATRGHTPPKDPDDDKTKK